MEEVGEEVSLFKKGDRVFGFNDETFGGHAEYLVIAEDKAITTIPEGLSFEEAAPITEGSHYALVNIRAANIQPGDRIMVAIGSAAVQLLKHLGTAVAAVVNTKNMGLIKSLGVDEVIDHEKEDFTRIGTQAETRFSFIFDAVASALSRNASPC